MNDHWNVPVFYDRTTRNKNCLWWPCLLRDQDEMSNLYRGPSIDASYQVLVPLAKWFQRRRLHKNWTARNKNFLWWPSSVLYNDCSFWHDPLTNMATIGNSCFWLVYFLKKSCPLKPLGQMNHNFGGRISFIQLLMYDKCSSFCTWKLYTQIIYIKTMRGESPAYKVITTNNLSFTSKTSKFQIKQKLEGQIIYFLHLSGQLIFFYKI
jgi:hypothetical protein